MSSSAFCSICSKGGREVQVLCEGRCLICSKCEQSPAIKKLMMECVEKGADTTEVTARCPICELPVSRSMLQTFLDGNTASKSNENDMFEQEHPFNAFLKKFRQSYKDVVGNDSNDLLSTLANDRPSTPNGQLCLTFSMFFRPNIPHRSPPIDPYHLRSSPHQSKWQTSITTTSKAQCKARSLSLGRDPAIHTCGDRRVGH